MGFQQPCPHPSPSQDKQLPAQSQAVGSDSHMQEMILVDQSEVQLHGPTVLVPVHYTKCHSLRGTAGADGDLCKRERLPPSCLGNLHPYTAVLIGGQRPWNQAGAALEPGWCPGPSPVPQHHCASTAPTRAGDVSLLLHNCTGKHLQALGKIHGSEALSSSDHCIKDIKKKKFPG